MEIYWTFGIGYWILERSESLATAVLQLAPPGQLPAVFPDRGPGPEEGGPELFL